MVYCSNCGLESPDDAKHCSRCGEELNVTKTEHTEDWGEEFGKKMEKWGEDLGKRMEDWGEGFGRNIEEECFRLPYIGVIVGLIIGIFLVIIGVSLLIGLNFEIWGRLFGSGMAIIIGIVVVISVIYKLARKRS